MVKQSITLDPDAQAYTDDEIVGKVNTAAVAITRAAAIDGAALSAVDSDDIAEGLANFFAGVSGADFVKASDTLEVILEGTTKKHFLNTEKTKLTGIEEGAKDDQSGAEMVTALEGLGAGSRLGSDKIDQELDAKFMTDAEETKVVAIDQVYSNAEKTKLTGVEDSATADQTGAEVRDIIVGLGDTERKILITEPLSGEFKVIAVQRDATGKLKVEYDDVAEP